MQRIHLIDPFNYPRSLCTDVLVVDGDTFKCNVQVKDNIFCKQTVRLIGIDAPELSTQRGKELKTILQRLLSEATVNVEGIGKDCYGRTLAIMYVEELMSDPYNAETNCLNDWLHQQNFALKGDKRMIRTDEQAELESGSIRAMLQHLQESDV